MVSSPDITDRNVKRVIDQRSKYFNRVLIYYHNMSKDHKYYIGNI